MDEICEDALLSYLHARDACKGRFKHGEYAITNNDLSMVLYFYFVLCFNHE